jgi:hypothetical protein
MARRVQALPPQTSRGDSSVPVYSERTIVIAGIIERYVTDHPRAADTPEGIRSWWVARQRFGDSVDEVQKALDYLVARRRLASSVLPDGTVIFRAARAPNDLEE